MVVDTLMQLLHSYTGTLIDSESALDCHTLFQIIGQSFSPTFTTMPAANQLEHDISSAIAGNLSAWRHDDDPFNSLAIRSFEYQYLSNIPYQNYCKSLRKSPNNVSHWLDIPTVPTDVFKLPSPLTCFPPENKRHTFTTSGTTGEIKGQHHFLSLNLYEQSIKAAWQQLTLPSPTDTTIILTHRPQDTPHSSLSHMMGVLARTSLVPPLWAIDREGHMDTAAIIRSLDKAEANKQTVVMLGTALAFLHLFEQLKSPFSLPNGSWAMETGGYKGTQRSLEKADLYALFDHHLGLPPDSIINEYSMTELSSQFYTTGLNKPHTGPYWTRTRIIDPLTESDTSPGQPGHLAIYDLANLHSVMAIRTQDIAITAPGDNKAGNKAGLATKPPSFTLIGRDPTALPRGCSRSADDTLRT